MLGKQFQNTDLFQCVTMEQLVPPDHVLRRLRAALDLSFVREKVAHLYSHLGRRSIDPEVVVRMWLLQHFYGYTERQICDEVTMHAGFRWFCGLSFNDAVPDQSTLVKLRTEKWAKTGLWEELLRETVRACEAAGLCRPGARQRLGIDGTMIDANAATVSLEALPPTLTVVEAGGEANEANEANETNETSPASPTAAVEATACEAPSPKPPAPTSPTLRVEAGGRPRGPHRSGDPEWHGERFSNATHRSTTDPEARLYRKNEGQEAKLRYLGHYLADLPSGVIYDARVTQATGTAEREAALTMLKGMQQPPGEVAMDLGYRDGDFLADVLALGIQPLVPLQDEPLEAEPQWQRRTFNPECQQRRERKQVVIHARNAVRRAVRGRRGAVAQRQRTRLEHLFGEAKEHHGMARAQGRGLNRLDQQVKLTAGVQNMKRLLRARPKRRVAAEATVAGAVSPTILAQIRGWEPPYGSTGAARPPMNARVRLPNLRRPENPPKVRSRHVHCKHPFFITLLRIRD